MSGDLPEHARRDFLTGQAMRTELGRAAERLAQSSPSRPSPPTRGPMVVLQTTAMACHFDVLLNVDGPPGQLEAASEALNRVHELEQQISVYRADSELSQLNRRAWETPVPVEARLYELLERCRELHRLTGGAFDPTSGPLIAAWRNARQENRIPTEPEIAIARQVSGMEHLRFDTAQHSVKFDHSGVDINLGAIGKGYAVDRAGEILQLANVENWLLHGGKSSILARGTHATHDGWPVGIRNPAFPDDWGTLLLKNAALGTSGTAVQGFRHQGKRYGHILDPRTGWPVEGMASVSVVAPNAALADALSTAFFVLGVENALKCCDNFTDVGVIMFPLPTLGRELKPVIHNIPADRLFPRDSFEIA